MATYVEDDADAHELATLREWSSAAEDVFLVRNPRGAAVRESAQLDSTLPGSFDDATDESPDDSGFAAPIDPTKLLHSLKSGDSGNDKPRSDAKGHAFSSRIVSLRPKSQVPAASALSR